MNGPLALSAANVPSDGTSKITGGMCDDPVVRYLEGVLSNFAIASTQGSRSGLAFFFAFFG